MHQDYTKGERIVVTETADNVSFQNAGNFYEGEYTDYIPGEKTPTKYRNEFLKTAMINLNMVDSQGFGIHDMFEHQRNRYLPMPDYETPDGKHVILTIPGNVINQEYSTALMENTDLDLSTIYLLDRVQKQKQISKEACSKLRQLKLIEGRYPNIMLGQKLAKITHTEVEYSNLKGFDDEYYKDMIIKALSDHQRLRSIQIDQLLIGKLPDVMSEKQKKYHIDYLLRVLRKAGKIHVGKNKYWEMGPGVS